MLLAQLWFWQLGKAIHTDNTWDEMLCMAQWVLIAVVLSTIRDWLWSRCGARPARSAYSPQQVQVKTRPVQLEAAKAQPEQPKPSSSP